MEYPKVRQAVPEDFEKIMGLCQQLYEENGAVNVKWDIVEQIVINGINGALGVLAVIGTEELKGMIYLRFSHMWYSQDLILEELFNFVPVEHRNGKNARALLDFAKNSADTLGLPLIIAVISNERTKAKMRLYSRVFGEAAGGFFLYNARTDQ